MLASTLSRFAPSAHNIQRSGIGFAAGLTTDQLMRAVPSAFAEGAHESRSGLTAGSYGSGADAIAAWDLAKADASEQGYAQHWAANAMRAPTFPQDAARAAFLEGRPLAPGALIPVAAPMAIDVHPSAVEKPRPSVPIHAAHYRPAGPALRLAPIDARLRIPARFAPSYLLAA